MCLLLHSNNVATQFGLYLNVEFVEAPIAKSSRSLAPITIIIIVPSLSLLQASARNLEPNVECIFLIDFFLYFISSYVVFRTCACVYIVCEAFGCA